MNSTSQEFNLTHKDFLLSELSATYLTDALILYLVAPIALSGSIFNLFGIVIFLKKPFRDISYFKYVLISFGNGFIVSFIMSFSFLMTPYILYDLSISYLARLYKCKIVYFVVGYFFFYGNILDVFTNIENALSYTNLFIKYKSISPYWISLFVFLICFIINIPNYFTFTISSDEELFVINKLCYKSSFISSSGRVLLGITLSIEGPLLLVVLLTSQIIIILSFKKYWKSKLEVLNIMPKAQKNIQKKIMIKDRKLFILTMLLTFFSCFFLFSQIIFQYVQYFGILNDKVLIAQFTFLYAFVVSFKHFLSIFFFYFFNTKFYKYINDLFSFNRI